MKNKLVPVIIILLLLAGGGYYLKTKNSGVPGAPQTTSQAMGEAAEFAKAIESGKPTTCTLTKGADTMEYVIKGKMMRANITTTVNGKAMLSHMINDEKYLYLWSADQKQGTKMSLTQPSPSPFASVEPQSTTPKFDSEADYQSMKDEGYTINCKAGSVTDLDFVPPADINFIDPTQMMQQVSAPGAAGGIDLEKLQQQYGGTVPAGE